ncbi:MAG: hypothetical protein JO155_00705 [Acidimicrobiia bacterium]|nr:hypothetical protein [Acidimicrobiia bacterium]
MKRRLVAVSVVGLLSLGAAILAIPAGSAATAPNVTCQPGQTLSGVYNNVLVPGTDNGANYCSIQGATINGTLTVQPGGAVVIGSGSTVHAITSNSAGTGTGDPLGLFATYNFSVIMCNSTVTSTMTINGSQSAVLIGDSDAGCGGNTLNGASNTLNDNHGGVEVDSNTVNGNLSVNDTTGHVAAVLDADSPPETTDVSNNSDSTHSLTCAGNAPTVVSSGNTFASYPGGQCGP